MTSKLKIFNDPLYGLIHIPSPILFDLIEHPFFQRLRRITQTGLSNLVYPGMVHTRFHHALGAMHLMQKAILVLRRKSVPITKAEEIASCIAILLHDIGHGPFSHALENSLVENQHHENISLLMMLELNKEFKGELSLAISIFKNQYHKKFLHQLISSQLDVDRLDYLKRDSFYSGVVEGNINSDRIITMINVANNELVIDQKGVHSIEKYLISRTLMYWQVYLHKTSVAAETYLVQILKRAKQYANKGGNLTASAAFDYFLTKKNDDFEIQDLQTFTQLDDYDVLSAIKTWQNCDDLILAKLCQMIINRKLPAVKITDKAINSKDLVKLTKQAEQILGVDNGSYFVHQSQLKVQPYNRNQSPIQLLKKNKKIVTLHESERAILIDSLKRNTIKYHLSYLDVKKNG